MNIKLFIPPVFESIYRKLMSGSRSKYKIGNYEIEIPPDFALPRYQKANRLYDRFLPVLVKNIDTENKNKIIIDVGANIGDTVIALLQNSDNPVICIEPSDFFFPYLERNLKAVPSSVSSRVKTIKKLVGTGLISGTLDHTDGRTATLKVDESQEVSTHVALDKLIDDKSDVILLKVDTDGFDFDVINSAEGILSESNPLLFWENEITEEFQLKGFNKVYELLRVKGYKYVYIFDNYGNLITESEGFDILKNINSYAYSIRKHNCTATFYYTDILAATEKYSLIAQNAVKEYRKEWINK
ncbi:MAG: FkbM family methyltransferase [Ignavibacteria bacterium]|jgi:FkbM family methyltransferase|nr:FkbM family methyltransferase [Ignavibacteria bacterium]